MVARHHTPLATCPSLKQILIGIGDMAGPPGCDSSLYSPASITVALGLHDTVRDAKKKLIIAASWKDELPDDFGLFDDVSEEPLKDAITVELAMSPVKMGSAGRGSSGLGGGRHAAAGGAGGLGGSRGPPPVMRLPWPYIGMLWAARLR